MLAVSEQTMNLIRLRRGSCVWPEGGLLEFIMECSRRALELSLFIFIYVDSVAPLLATLGLVGCFSDVTLCCAC